MDSLTIAIIQNTETLNFYGGILVFSLGFISILLIGLFVIYYTLRGN